MKKLLLWLVVLMLVATFSLVGCKAAEGVEPVVEEEEAVVLAEEVEKVEEAVVAKETTVKDEYRFVMIPILVQSWFDIVYQASVEAADILGDAMGTKITIDYQAPKEADVIVQNQLLEAAIATRPDGIAIDPNDVEASLSILKEAEKQGIPLVVYVAKVPELGTAIPYIGTHLYEDAMIIGTALLEKIDYKGKVAIIQGVPTNTAHSERYRAYKDLFAQYPEIEIVAEAFDYDDIEKAQAEAVKIISANPDLDAFAICDAAGPVGVGLAIQEANKVGEIVYIGIDTLPQLQKLMRDGVLDISFYSSAKVFGQWCTISLMMQNLGMALPDWYDVGMAEMTPDVVKDGDVDL